MNLKRLINKGLLTVYGPLTSFVLICGFTANWFAKNILNYEKSDFIITITVVIATMIGWIWWSYKIVKWKYWAFSQINIENSYDLYEKAIGVGLIWPTGSIFNKTEIWTEKDKQNWEKLNPEIRDIFKVKKV
ncbi:hypothetical protein Q4Q35_04655 [Flavivirga aquimarina]|uniref:PH domain-containing protein n=1 Tax=Flavivirga aquimarina TaxID=2027862 RepID=A0ABT8W7M0_9FLAO|nr:hypothetical protein [Flavivirga aquimarina]MDO5969091.1 hypothetical protein [Flavivirga aquimarina]